MLRAERVQRLHLRRSSAQEFGFLGAAPSSCFPRPRLRWHAHRARRAGHVRGAAGRRDHRLAVPAGVHQHRRRRHPGARSPGSRCRSSAPVARRSSSASRPSASSCRSPARRSRREPGTTMRLLIAAGGTGGHIYPALAVARSLRAAEAGTAPPELSWIGGRRGLEAALVPPAGIPLHRLVLRSLRTVDRSVHTIADPSAWPPRSRRPRRSWPRERPAAIFTTGGYVAVPVLMAAAPLRIPVVLWDGNVIPGRAVRADRAARRRGRRCRSRRPAVRLPPRSVTGRVSSPARRSATSRRSTARPPVSSSTSRRANGSC